MPSVLWVATALAFGLLDALRELLLAAVLGRRSKRECLYYSLLSALPSAVPVLIIVPSHRRCGAVGSALTVLVRYTVRRCLITRADVVRAVTLFML